MSLRILEIGNCGAAAYAGRVFVADGAEVIRVNQPRPPGPGDVRRDALELFLHAGKQQVQLDLRERADLARCHDLARDADVLIVDESPRRFDQLGLTALAAENHHLLIVTITPFGLSGPYRDWQGGNAILLAMGGYTHLIGDPDEAPLSLPGHYAEYQAGQYAYAAAMARLIAGKPSGTAADRLIEVSILETVLSLSQFTTVMWSCQGAVRGRSGFSWTSFSCVGLYPCKDGWMGVNALPQFWDAFLLMLDRPELALDPRFATNQSRLQHRAEVDRIIAEAFSHFTMAELLEMGQRTYRVPCGSMLDMQGLLADEHLEARDFWDRVETDDGKAVRIPGLPYHMPGAVRAQTRRFIGPAELTPGESAPTSGGWQARPPLDRAIARPLSNCRILDLTHVWAGPLATRILADLGADVIKVESPFIRGPAKVAPGLLGMQVDAPDEPDHWNRNGLFNKLNRNKRGLCINLKTAEGRALFLDLAAHADVVIENFSAATMNKLGVGYDQLRAVNEEILYLSMPGYGSYGPLSDFVAYGPSVEPMTGLGP